MTSEERADRRRVRGINVLIGTMIGVLALTVGLVIYWLARPTPFDPFTFQTVKIEEVLDGGLVVIPQVEGFDAPSVYVDDDVPAMYPRCNSHDADVPAFGNSWMVNATTGDRYELNQDVDSVIPPGCASPRFRLQIPVQVQVDLLDTASGNAPSREASAWYVYGELTPKRAGGVTASYQSETFFIIAAYRSEAVR